MRPKGLWTWHSDCLRFLHSASPYPYQLHLDTFQKVALVTNLNTFSQLATPSSVRSLPYKLRKSWKLTQFLACIYMESFDSFLSKHVCLVSANTWSKVESIFVLTSLYDTMFSIKTTWRKKSFINLSHQFSVQWNGKAFFFFFLGSRSRALAEVFPLVVRSKLNISVLTTHLFGAPVFSDLCLLQSMMSSHLHTFLSHCPYQRLDNINTGRPTTKIPLVSHFFLNLYVHSLCTMLDKVPTLP